MDAPKRVKLRWNQSINQLINQSINQSISLLQKKWWSNQTKPTYGNNCTFSTFCSDVYFCLYGPFNCISFHKSSQQCSAFSLCSADLNSALLILFIYICLCESLPSPAMIHNGWLRSKTHINKFSVLLDTNWRCRLESPLRPFAIIRGSDSLSFLCGSLKPGELLQLTG